jgi:hypothetical protein
MEFCDKYIDSLHARLFRATFSIRGYKVSGTVKSTDEPLLNQYR